MHHTDPQNLVSRDPAAKFHAAQESVHPPVRHNSWLRGFPLFGGFETFRQPLINLFLKMAKHALSRHTTLRGTVLPQVRFKPPLSTREAAFLHELQTERIM